MRFWDSLEIILVVEIGFYIGSLVEIISDKFIEMNINVVWDLMKYI